MTTTVNSFPDFTEAMKAYLAGLTDGEGYVSIEKSWRKDTNRYRYRPVVQITNTNEEIIRWLKSMFGFGYFYARKALKENWKPSFIFTLKGGSALYFLELIRKHTQIKKAQVEAILSMPANEESWAILKGMNKRGVDECDRASLSPV